MKKSVAQQAQEILKKAVSIDAINPAHYRQGGIETIEYLEAIGVAEPFCVGNAIKYLSRYKMKNGVTDVKKAGWYIDRLIKILEAKKGE